MATEQDDRDIPESGGVFTFGKSKFAENLPNKFWIRNDEVTQVACGDQHTVLYAESGRVFVFGDSSYGQLGLGNTKAQTKPTCVKSLKGEQVSVIGCGSDHTLVGTSSGVLFTFGKNNYHQCGLDAEGSVETPTEVLLKKPIVFTQLCGGSSHSVGLDKNGLVYVWGDNSEGQLGLGDGVSEAELPEQLRLDEKAVHISCGYYHTAVVTVSGALYTFGEEEGGKLGHGEGVIASEPLQVDIPDKVVWVSCGGRHTVAVTARGAVYSFGDGSDGQLGLGTNTMDTSKPTLVTYLKDIRIKRSSCGENFTAVISEKGQLYTFGNGRHGKLALGAENFTNQFRPFRVPRFAKFSVTKVSCGGCHTIALAHKKDLDDDGEDEEIHDPLNSTFANSLRLSTDLDSSISARDRRRSKDLPEARNRTLPPLTASSRSSTLPPLTSTLPSLDGAKMPTSLDKRKLPNAKFTQGDKEEDSEDSDVSVTPEGSSEEEENETVQRSMSNKREAMKKQSSSLANGKGKPTLKSKQLPKPNSKAQKEDTADEDSEVDSEEETQYRHKKRGDKTSKKVSKKELDSEEEEETTTKRGKSVVAKNKKNQKQKSLSEEDSALEDSEEEESEEEKRHNSNKSSKNAVKKSSGKEKKRSSKISEEDEEDSEAEDRKQKGKDRKSKLSVFGKGKKVLEDSEDDDDEEEEEEVKEKVSKSKTKPGKGKKQAKSKEASEEEDEDEEEVGKGDSKKSKESSSNNNATDEKPEKKSRACVIL